MINREEKIPGNSGMVLFITVVVVLAISAVSIGMITSSYLNKSVAENYREKMRSFYAADGQMTLLAQEVVDSNAHKYCPVLTKGGTQDTSSENKVIINSFNSSFDWGNNLTTPAQRAITEKTGFTNTNLEGEENIYLAMNGSSSQLGMAVEGLSEGGEITIRIKSDNMTADKIAAKLYSSGVYEKVYLSNHGTISSGYSDITIPLSDFADLGVDVSNAIAFYLDFYPENSLKEVRVDHIEAAGVSSTADSTASDTLVNVTGFTATGSTERQPASYAFDQNTNTRWESDHDVDPQWIMIDLETEHNVSGVTVDWEMASASDYEIQGSNDGNDWITLSQQSGLSAQQHRIDSIVFEPQNCRYIRMYGTQRSYGYGYSIFEMRIYAAPQAAGSMAVDTVQIGDFSVEWKMQEIKPFSYNLETQSFKNNNSGRIVFRTTLKQYIEVASSEIYNPWDDTALVPVTFYDFHSDRRNPEFEQPHSGLDYTVVENMVDSTLDNDRKPVPGTSIFLNKYIKYWFRPWADSAKGDSTIPVYNSTTMDLPVSLGHKFRRWTIPDPDLDWGYCDSYEFASDNLFKTIITLDSASIAGTNLPRADKAFENVVIHDTLKFWLVDSATGTYKFDDQEFFRLDDMGFGNEWNYFRDLEEETGSDHNFSFTMEIKRQFVMVPDLFFVFEGDDDVWTFIDNRLVMDIGGIHYAIKDSVTLDSIPDLEHKKVYNFDFFYCERHSSASSITITTNLLEYRPPTTKRRHWKRDYGMID